MIPTRERCQACHQISPVGFHVPDTMWRAVVHPHFQNSILCLPCFISRADEKLIDWSAVITLYPVSLASHLQAAGVLNLPTWCCRAQRTGVGGGDPQDCNWPVCGCDPSASRVIEALEESGAFLPREAAS